MYAILVSFGWTLLSWLIRTVILKFVIFAGIYLVVSSFLPVLIGQVIPSGDGGLSGALAGLTPGVWYFLDLFRADVGIPMVCAAWASRFIIRRIPVIG
jgi:hypothetical protein